mmetsp:Transcript_4723/g.9032  ORF Transcript_4723/g.9032 Transcript_4723/m.9032 type:complete len:743 (-) Transcript_4723:418-2646(-)
MSSKTLLAFSESDSDSEQSNDNHIRINKTFADDYEKRKRRQELLNAKQKDEDTSDYDSSSDESEDEDAELLTSKVDLQILKTINALRQKDDSIYDQNKKFFSEEEDNSSTSHENKVRRSKSKAKTYKDIVREEILQKMGKDDAGNFVDSESDNEQKYIRLEQSQDRLKKLAYDDEQKALRKEFLQDGGDEENIGEDDDGDDDWLVKKKKSDDFKDENNKERLAAIDALSKTVELNGSTSADPKGEVVDGDKFLLDFIKNKRWIDHNDNDSDDDSHGQTPTERRVDEEMDDDGHDSDSSLKELDRTDAFESKYNFRFEEANDNSGAGLSVIGYSRSALSDTIRRKDETRRMKRQQHKERKEAERKAKEERLRRLKNAKKEELEERINQIKSVLGEKVDTNIDQEVVAKLMEGDFDPDKFEELMSKMYSDEFYEKEEQEWKTDMDVKRSLLKSGEEGNDIVWNDEGDGDVYDDAEEALADYDNDEYHEDDEQDFDDTSQDHAMELEDENSARYESNESKLEKQLKERMLDELYKLDYEDIIGDMPTRFKYRKVEPNRYGLTPEEILFARDTSLKQYVSLKRMAPYIEEREYVPGAKKRRRFREMSKKEIAEEMQQYASEKGQRKTKGEGEEDQDQPKKKRRRQKKKSHKDDKHSNEKSQQISNSAKDKQNGSKSKRTDSPKNYEQNFKEKQIEGKTEKRKSTKLKESTSPVSKASKKERNKSQKKSKKQKVDGISASRLASYGL